MMPRLSYPWSGMTPSSVPWRPLDDFRAGSIPKLNNLRRVARAGLDVPATIWAWASELESDPTPRLPAEVMPLPCIVRSGSPTEDSAATSHAGQCLSVVVRDTEHLAAAVSSVVKSLPLQEGCHRGVVFVQPLIETEVAGITVFDGFYYEETDAARSNQAVTSVRERGNVRRGHVERGDPHIDWLLRVHKHFGGIIEIEWAGGGAAGPTAAPYLLQVRPVLGPIQRCETLSLANHKEVFGDPPRPWIAGVLAESGRSVLDYFETVEPVVAAWHEQYAIECGERVWMNLSFFFRLMDEWGLPRTLVTEGVGGEARGPLDGKLLPGRFVRKIPTIVSMGLVNLATIAATRRGLRALDSDLESARTLLDLQRANVRALAFSIRSNFAILMILAIASKLRKALGLGRAARVITHQMMTQFASIAARTDIADRMRGLDDWLRQYGHRGPLESDPYQPRFAEQRRTLSTALQREPTRTPRDWPEPSAVRVALGRFLFLSDEVREWFRDRLMRWWQRLRMRILAESQRAVAAGFLDDASDIFYLRSDDLAADPRTWRERVATRRRLWAQAKQLRLPSTASRDVIEAALAHPNRAKLAASPGRFAGIGLGSAPVCGTAVRGDDLSSFLNGKVLPESPVLVAATLEPAWAVIFPRFAAVVAELGGELSHAAILLREAGIPAVVNAQGAFQHIADGDRVYVDPVRGEVKIEK